MKQLFLLTITLILLAACGPDRAQTIDPPPAATEQQVSTVEPIKSAATPTVESAPTDSPTVAPTAEPQPTEESTQAPDNDVTDIDQEALLAALLTLDDMPTGWTGTAPVFETRTPGGTYNTFCTELPARSIAAATVDFEKSSLGPFLSHAIVVYPTREDAEDALNDLIAAAQDCTEFTDDQGNTITVSPLSFPKLGDDTFAVRAAGLVEMDIINVRIDNVLISIRHGGLGAIDSAQTEAFARAAVDHYGR